MHGGVQGVTSLKVQKTESSQTKQPPPKCVFTQTNATFNLLYMIDMTLTIGDCFQKFSCLLLDA